MEIYTSFFQMGSLKYIGQRQKKGIKTRLSQHLFGKSLSVNNKGIQNGTVSKWHKVNEEIEKGNIITFKTILILNTLSFSVFSLFLFSFNFVKILNHS